MLPCQGRIEGGLWRLIGLWSLDRDAKSWGLWHLVMDTNKGGYGSFLTISYVTGSGAPYNGLKTLKAGHFKWTSALK